MPKPYLRRFRLAADICLCSTHFVFQKGPLLSMVVNVFLFYVFLKTPNRRGAQFHVEELSNFDPSSHIDPIGERSDV